MRGAIPDEESVLLLMGKTAMNKKSYLRQVPRIDLDTSLSLLRRRHRSRNKRLLLLQTEAALARLNVSLRFGHWFER